MPMLQVTPLFGAIMQKALELVVTCDCANDSGCPACVQHPDCNEYNAVLSKRSAVLVLQATLQVEAEHRARMALQARAVTSLSLLASQLVYIDLQMVCLHPIYRGPADDAVVRMQQIQWRQRCMRKFCDRLNWQQQRAGKTEGNVCGTDVAIPLSVERPV